MLVSSWALEGLRALLPATVPRVSAIRLDVAAVAFAVAVSAARRPAFGTAPAWMSAGLASFDALREGGRTSTGGRHWLRRGLVVGQVALASVLLTAAGVMGASLLKLQRVDVGFAGGRRRHAAARAAAVALRPRRPDAVLRVRSPRGWRTIRG